MRFEIKDGNLIEENATFIVNASNTELTLGSGVSHAFSEYCGGTEYQKELYELKKKFGVIEQGDVLLSSSGSAINFKYALHVAVMNYSDSSKPPYPSYVQIQRALNSILNIVEERVKDEKILNPKLVIPLLGCGVGGLQKEKVFLLIKSVFQKAKIDLDVIIYFHDKQDFYTFTKKE
ncbi:MAG: macro domain-containing protein [Campylobacterales bacterium]|nr:macro domain-containing protein [Campylobacterales bacterium]